MSIARRIGAVLGAVAVGLLVLGNAVVDKFAATSPAVAAQVWSSHPAVEIAVAMQDIAEAARNRQQASDDALLKLRDAATREPLAPEPFLAHGIASDLAGQPATAQAAFEAAKLRDPRSLPARYFLSGLYLRSNDIRRGLQEVADFAKLSPNGIAAIGPFVAAVARQKSTWPDLRALFRDDALIEETSLVALAADPANARTVLALQGRRRSAADAPWIGVLIRSLVDHQDYQQARAVFENALKPVPRSDSLLFDAAFDDLDAPPPFNWTLASSTVGLAERQKAGRLHVIFYGQEDGVLASQLLVLPRGSYHLAMTVSGAEAASGSLSWKLRCANGGKELLVVPLPMAGGTEARFNVPADCPAQWIELSGRSGDIAQSSDVTITRLSLERETPRA